VWSAYLDASALAKKYVPEPGSGTVQYLFTRVPRDRQAVLSVGVAEVISVFVRRRNLVLVACDLRLLRAAQAEGLITFDPERQTHSDLDAILGP
jgi:predicted nucleic acid-binding protein